MFYITDTQSLGQQLKLLRKQTRLSQGDLALRAGLSRTAIQAIEKGKETYQLDTLLKVLQILNVRMGIDHPLLKANVDAKLTD
ncbi:helix-turn-helix transcriptional regulator [Candidatus Odyssella thessalonicensis]|uniref:helix-turn-helix transcriptional regulator n=1 Tax=Candidatus Odyssella thessalonicensis TaxID=84647 RepID=UPI00030BBB18|nr:helix-turn-helix transcriptional regulator [Candidatus Odyssella thessalonicensis]